MLIDGLSFLACPSQALSSLTPPSSRAKTDDDALSRLKGHVGRQKPQTECASTSENTMTIIVVGVIDIA